MKDSPQNTLVFVTRLDNALPVDGAKVSIVTLENTIAWTGTTNADGVAIAPALPLRGPKRWYENKFEFLVTAEKEGDVAYLGSDWTEGVDPWEFGISYDAAEQHSLLRGTVFADRGVYRLGEEIHYKAILRHDTAAGIKVPDAGTPVYVSVRDSQDREIDQREVKLSAWGSVEWTQTLPAEGALGNYSVRMRLRPYTTTTKKPSGELARELNVQNEVDSEPDANEPRDSISGGFLVAAYRRPDFRVDATLTSATPFAGTTLTGTVTARYLFGAAMKSAPVRWTFSRTADLRRRRRRCSATSRSKASPSAPGRRTTAAPSCAPTRTRPTPRAASTSSSTPRAAMASATTTRSRAKSPTCRGSASPTARRSASTRPRSTSASSCPTSSISRPASTRRWSR